MKRVGIFRFVLILFLSFQVAVPPGLLAQGAEGPKPFTQEELDQLLAPIALHPDSLLAQILMASTYPLEVVQADRWAKQNKNLKGDALAAALEKQTWDPSIKSLVNFPQALQMADVFLTNGMPLAESRTLEDSGTDLGDVMRQGEPHRLFQRDTFQHGTSSSMINL